MNQPVNQPVNEPVNDEEVVRQAREALRAVYDPELGVDVVALGLVYGLGVEDDRLVIEMTLTTPGCPVSESLPDEATRAVAGAIGGSGRSVELRIVWDPPWSPERMDERAATMLGFG